MRPIGAYITGIYSAFNRGLYHGYIYIEFFSVILRLYKKGFLFGASIKKTGLGFLGVIKS